MSLLILKPASGEPAYEQAANIFAKMYEAVTHRVCSLSEKDDGKSDLVVIGSDAVNDFLMNEMLEGIFGALNIRYGTDDYRICSYKKGERNVLVLAGGRGRSTIYAAYDYFERFAGCRYYWDGDVIPKCKFLPFENINVIESPRFEYRGLRYFAHRGLKRFQAEHWSFEDWKREIDWMMKKRLNLFMLRIGMDDAWQRAFPDIVPYPESYRNVTDEKGYDDRSDFWTQEYRGELRKKIMQYARSNDIMSPTDCGTMTHWYSRTPHEFLEKKKPKFLDQECNQYNEFATGCVFDFREKENMDYYMKLTETMASEYDDNNFLFHTIGLGERRIYKDNKKNFRLKQLCYRRIAQALREKFPNSKLMLASWDFVGWWQPEEVCSLIDELDPERTIILDYTSEGTDKIQNFTKWGVVNKFPWIYGLFHAYESESELRGQYDIADERLKIAADDPYCKGMILWPELAHSDPIVLEYLSENSWSPLKKKTETVTEEFCSGRYGKLSAQMNECWQMFLPFMKLNGWGGYTRVEDDYFRTDSFWCTHSDIWVKPFFAINNCFGNAQNKLHTEKFYENAIRKSSKYIHTLSEITERLAEICENTEDMFIIRDSIDIVRTICGRFLNFIAAQIIFEKYNHKVLAEIRKTYIRLLTSLSDLVRFNPDFSLYATFNALKQTAPVNPDFEKTLKQNIINNYCRQCCGELIDFVFIDEADALFDMAEGKCDKFAAEEKSKKICDKFFDTPLGDMQKKSAKPLHEVMYDISVQIENLSELFPV